LNDLPSLTSDPQFFRTLNNNTIKVLEREIGEAGKEYNMIIGLETHS